MPARNEKDLVDIPQYVKDEMDFVFAKQLDDVLEAALEGGHPGRRDGVNVAVAEQPQA